MICLTIRTYKVLARRYLLGFEILRNWFHPVKGFWREGHPVKMLRLSGLPITAKNRNMTKRKDEVYVVEV